MDLQHFQPQRRKMVRDLSREAAAALNAITNLCYCRFVC